MMFFASFLVFVELVCLAFHLELGLALVFVGLVLVFCGEFDPGSGRTLAACLTHASRTMKPGLFVLVD